MSDEIIYSLLDKAQNLHYAKRYIRFIQTFHNTGGKVKHHILPKAKDMWPEFADLKRHKWNEALLTNRQHFVAHWLLWKALGGSQTSAFWRMASKTSRHYSNLREEHSKLISEFKKRWWSKQPKNVKIKEKRTHEQRVEAYRKTISSEEWLEKTGYEKFKKQSESLKKVYQNEEWQVTTGEVKRQKCRQSKLENNPGFAATLTCPHCGKKGQNANMKRWHFDNCKKQQ